MANENAPRLDEVSVQLNDETVVGKTPDESGYESQPPTLARPADSANRATWVDYLESLGYSRWYLENDTQHIGSRTEMRVIETDEGMVSAEVPLEDTHPALSKKQLVELADQRQKAPPVPQDS